MGPRPVRGDEEAAVVAFIARMQSDATTAVSAFGTAVDGIRAELDDLAPRWTTTARVLDDLAGASVVGWDRELGQAYVSAWGDDLPALLDAAIAQVPAGVEQLEIGIDVANRALAAAAAALGLEPGPVNLALAVDGATAAAWAVDAAAVRPASPADLPRLERLHEAEFPTSYLPVGRFLGDPRRVTLVAPDGYATGELLADGEGFVDFVAVEPGARGAGVGRALVVALTRSLLDRGASRVCLTVREVNAPARALYESLGFRVDATLVAHRGPVPR